MAAPRGRSQLRPALSFLVLLVLLVSTDILKTEAKLCEERSKTWTGPCPVYATEHCDQVCREREQADHGACHWEFPGFACFCYKNC